MRSFVRHGVDGAVRLLVAGVVAVAVVPFLASSSGERPGQTVRSRLAGQQVRLQLPADGIEPKGLVLWFHGQGGNVNDRVDGPFLDALRRDGWAIASSNFHAQAWGNAPSTRDTELLTRWAERRTGRSVSVWVAGSMGASTSLNAMLHGVSAPPCWYGVKPAIALNDMQHVPGGPRFIRQAFGGSPPEDRIPVDNVAALPVGTRYRVVASEQDTWVHYDQNAQPLVDQLSARGADVTVLPVIGGHDDPSHFNPRDLLAFANSCLALDGA